MDLPKFRKLRIVGKPIVVAPPPPPSFEKSDRSRMGQTYIHNRGSVGSETRQFKHHSRYPRTTKHVYLRHHQIVTITTTTLPKSESEGEGIMSIHKPIKPLVFK